MAGRPTGAGAEHDGAAPGGDDPAPPTGAELARGLEQYRRLGGRRPPALDGDTGQALAGWFDAPQPALGMGANEGEWLMLELGLKPVLRQTLDPQDVERLRERCRREGWELLVVEQGRPATEPRWRAELRLRLGGAERVDGAATAPLLRSRVYVGRALSALERLAELESGVTPHQYVAPTSPVIVAVKAALRAATGALGPRLRGFRRLADLQTPRARRRARAMRQRVLQIGEALGYPPCCAEHFAAFPHMHDNRQPIASAAAATARFDPLLNNLSLSLPHLIPWTPCRFDCPASLEVARRVDDELARRSPVGHDALARLLALPRLYVDDRRQLLFDGELRDGWLHYRAVHTPCAFDRSRRLRGLEWAFFCDVAPPLLGGDRLRIADRSWTVASGERTVRELPAPDGVWLPFGRG